MTSCYSDHNTMNARQLLSWGENTTLSGILRFPHFFSSTHVYWTIKLLHFISLWKISIKLKHKRLQKCADTTMTCLFWGIICRPHCVIPISKYLVLYSPSRHPASPYGRFTCIMELLHNISYFISYFIALSYVYS